MGFIVQTVVALIFVGAILGEEWNLTNSVEAINDDKKLDEISYHRIRSLPETEDTLTTNWTTISEILDIFNVKHLARKWIEGQYSVDAQCGKDITRYIQGLKKQEFWAIKVDDASGRYTNGYFWGNSYFTGSATECYFIGKRNEKRTFYSTSKDDGVQEFNNEPKRRINAGQSGVSNSLDDAPDDPPYPLSFFILKISLNETSLTMKKLIHLGVCLPFSCSSSDVAEIAKLAASDAASKYSSVENVRDQRNYYDIYTDSVFWVLFGVSAVVLVLMIVGTSYDVYLTNRLIKQQKESCDVEKHAKLEQLTNGNHKPLTVGDTVVNGSSPVNNNNDHEGSLRSSTPDCQQLNVCEELLLSFSVRANMKTICDPSVGRDTISTIHGLRAISMAWVILGHTCIVVFKYSDNMEYRRVVEKNILFQTVTNGAFSVDTFFFMGGLLVSFLYFRTNAEGHLNKLTQGTRGFVAGFLKFIGFLAYRFSRLTAPYMFVLGVVEVTMKWFHYNAVFETPTADHENCPNYWWRNLLYINTLFPVEQMCMLWSWYVADDTQFYVVGAVILILATNHFKIAAFSVVTLMVSSWLTTGYIALINNHMPSIDDPLALFDKIYDKPWTRLGPYLIGMSVGYFLFKTDCKVKMSKITVFVGWLLSSACLLSLLYGLYEAELSPITAAAYSSLSHSAWALGLAWIVIACSTGYGGYVDVILSAPILYPFSRVTYCAYLIHPIVIRLTAMYVDSPFHLGKNSMMVMFFGQFVTSYIISFVVSLSFEAPVVSMLKILSPKKRKRIQ
ncbi:nose resistant to fluoxetine protein 6-like isoform X2 [Leptopilina boulardi]|uniref:nose resistant to fluoxetine protein 6-like isoform X2 n=1 Tax=Leptopilina boulardi TaxID=63433 RepID=UPI0021F550FD|nr:nose resistant to fluoxetine protein 6-like isoform X2 [Leptopilina boulardi]